MAKRKNPVVALIRLPATIWQFIKEARDELRKVTWPTRETTVRFTILVVIISLVVGAVTGGLDYLLQQILERIAF